MALIQDKGNIKVNSRRGELIRDINGWDPIRPRGPSWTPLLFAYVVGR